MNTLEEFTTVKALVLQYVGMIERFIYRECFNDRMAKIKCDNCGKNIIKPRCRIEKYRSHFCDMKCKSRFHSKAMSGEKNPRWKGGNSCGYISKQSKKAAGHRDFCEICGITKADLKKRMYVHHIDENRNNNTRENLIVMCPSCHAKKHNRGERLNGYINRV